MGAVTNEARAYRFIREFNADFVRVYGLKDENYAVGDSEGGRGLYYDAVFQVVRFGVNLRLDGEAMSLTVDAAGYWDISGTVTACEMANQLGSTLNLDGDVDAVAARLRLVFP